jgi:hypothetical protein
MEYNLDECDVSIENNLLMIKNGKNVMKIPIHNINYINIVWREKPTTKLYITMVVGLILSFLLIGIPLLIQAVKKYLQLKSQKNKIILNAGNNIILESRNDELIDNLYYTLHNQITDIKS